MIEIPLTAEEFAAKSQQLAQEHGIVLSGSSGTVERSGVKASYAYADGVLAVTILEKPFFVSTEHCEQELRAFLGQ